MKNEIIIQKIKKIAENNELLIVYVKKKFETEYYLSNKNFYVENKNKFNLEQTFIVNDIDYDFLNICNPKNHNIQVNLDNNIHLLLLTELLSCEKIKLSEIKQINFNEGYKPYRDWNQVLNLISYSNENQNLSIITNKYISEIKGYDLGNLFTTLIKNNINNNPVDNILGFLKNHKEKLKNNHINYIQNYFIKKANEKQLTCFFDMFNIKNNDDKEISLFEEKNNNFDFLNLNAELFMKKFYFNNYENKVTSIEDYQKILRDTISFLKSNKNKLYVENIYLENRVANKNEFLITIEKKENFNKELFKSILLKYVEIYIEVIRKEYPKDTNWMFEVATEMKKNKQKITEYIFLNLNLKCKEKIQLNKQKIQLNKQKI